MMMMMMMKGAKVVSEMSSLAVVVVIVMCCILTTVSGSPVSGTERNVTQKHTQLKTSWTIAELTNQHFPKLISDDIDMDPCKGDGFLGDIALPNVQYDTEWKAQALNESYQKVLEKYKKQIFMEGLQVEEEGLVGLQENLERKLEKESQSQSTLDHDDDASVEAKKKKKSKRANKHGKSSKKNKSRNRQRKNNNRDEKKKKKAKEDKKHGKRMRGGRRRDNGGEKEEGEKLKKVDPLRRVRDVREQRLEEEVLGVEDLVKEGDQQAHRRRVVRAATARKERVWDYGVIPYMIDANFSGAHKALFKQAMRHWENFTCLQFVERDPAEHPNYIIFTERPCGCCSFVGKRGNGAQAISIGKNCDKFGIVVHELGHVVGFWHEHTRPDRDHHVVIIRDNIMLGQEYNFNKLTDEEVNSLGLNYDYDSIMHYARNTFSKGTYLNTILPRGIRHNKEPPEIGQRVRLSEGDIAQTNLLYRCFRCGRTLQESSGSFSSPSYPNSSPGNDGERCEWRISATHGEFIVLNITDLDIFLSDDCKTDYVEVRDGYWHKSNVLGRFCGTSEMSIDNIASTGSRMVVRYVTSNRQVGHRGFTVNYEVVCGGDLFMEGTGVLESPNYPDDYPPNKECIWRITTTPQFKVALKFQSFEVENHDNCVYDYLEIRDGLSLDSPLIGVYCGYKLPPDVESSANELLIKFVSDGSVQKSGFSLTYMTEYDECAGNTEHECEHECINTLGGYKCSCRIGYDLHSDGKHCEGTCGEVINALNGTITSPSFPKLYPVNKLCVWEIIAPLQYRVILNFTHFDLEGNNMFQHHCEYDSVTVYSKTMYGLFREGVFCGTNLPGPVTSEENALRIEFKSDNSVSKSGFAAIFLTDLDECATNQGGCQHECRNTVGSYECLCRNGFKLHENGHDCKEGGCKHKIALPNGVIKSPNYPDYYPSRKDCVWHFTTTPGHRIKLVFAEFELEPHQECAYDHVVIYDGDTADAPTLGRFCGSKVPHPILATGNQMLMVFKSDASVQRRGFNATHSTACGGHLQAGGPVQHLYSHARYGDFTYGNKADCDWVIEAQPGENVYLMFLTFEVEDDGDCNFDYVEVFAGMDSSAPSLGRFCGNAIPPEIVSPMESLLIRFRSDDSIGGKGFSAAYIVNDPPNSVDMSAEVDPVKKYSSEDYDPMFISSVELDKKEKPT